MFETLSGIFGTKKNSNSLTTTGKPAESDVSVRSPDHVKSLEQLVKVGPVTFVLVHADWCGPCQSYKPVWSELERSPGRKANMAMIHHDMVEHAPILKKAKIPGFPTVLKVYPDGKIEEYKQNSQKTNAVPNIRDKETMLSELRSIPVATQENSSRKSMIMKPVTKTLGPSRQITISPQQLARNARSLKSTPINYSKLSPLQSSHPVSVDSRPRVVPRTIQPMRAQLPKSLQISPRPFSPMMPPRPMSPMPMMPLAQMPQMQPGRRQTPIMTGGALYTALSSALSRAGPASLLFAASQMLPPKKNTGSSMRLTRRASRNSGSSRSRSRRSRR